MGISKVDYEMVEMARVVFWKTTRKHSALILPLDVVTSDSERKGSSQIFEFNKIPGHLATYDIGPKTITLFEEHIKNAGTVIWNGPMGLYEDPRFKKGTDSVLKQISLNKGTTIIGGGDTLTSIRMKKYINLITHVSTGGSAMLAFLEKGTLPGIEVLLDA
jgi:phosphoglycerate kinase